jgi:hypothetical protein
MGEMEKSRPHSCEFVFLSHATTLSSRFRFTALLVCWNISEAWMMYYCEFTKDGFNNLNWAEKHISLRNVASLLEFHSSSKLWCMVIFV